MAVELMSAFHPLAVGLPEAAPKIIGVPSNTDLRQLDLSNAWPL